MKKVEVKELGPYRRYKRLSDRRPIEARLVNVGDRKLMEIREKASEICRCPECDLMISVLHPGDEHLLTYLEPPEFHPRHRLLDNK